MTMIKAHKAFFILLLVSAVALFINVGSYGLLESSDARYAEIARMMHVSGDYLNPNLLEVHHFHKPPVTYQLTSLGYDLFGVNAFGARFFLQLAILVQLVLVYALTLALFAKKETALWATMIYFSFPLVLLASRNLTTDGFLAMFALLSIYAWVSYRKSGRYGYLYLFTLSLALGFLTKGPVVFLVPLIFVFAYNSVEKAKNGFSYHHLLAWSLFLGVGASWYIYLIVQNPTFLDYLVGKQTVDRFAKNAFDRTEPFWYFVALAPLAGLPWLFALPYLLKKQWSLVSRRSITLALLLAVAIPLFFFSLSSSKRILYILPLYSMFAVLTAYLISRAQAAESRVVGRIVLGYALLFFAIFGASLFIDLGLVIPTAVAVSALALMGVVIWLYRSAALDANRAPFYIAYLVGLFLVIGSGFVLSANPLKSQMTDPLTDFIKAQKVEDRTVLVYNIRKPSIAFNLNKMIVSLYDGSPTLAREVQFEKDLEWKRYLIDMKSDEEVAYLKTLMEAPTVLLVYDNPVQRHSKWLFDYYSHQKAMGKWTIYW